MAINGRLRGSAGLLGGILLSLSTIISIATIAFLIVLTTLAKRSDISTTKLVVLIITLIFNILAFAGFLILATYLRRHRSSQYTIRSLHKWSAGGLLIITIIAMMLSFVAAGLHISVTTTVEASKFKTYAVLIIITTILTMILEATFVYFSYQSILRLRGNRSSHVTHDSSYTGSELKESPKSDRKFKAYDQVLPPHSPDLPDFPIITPQQPRTTSLRNSLQGIIQPMTSASRLLRHKSFQSTRSDISDDRSSWGNRAGESLEYQRYHDLETNYDPTQSNNIYTRPSSKNGNMRQVRSPTPLGIFITDPDPSLELLDETTDLAPPHERRNSNPRSMRRPSQRDLQCTPRRLSSSSTVQPIVTDETHIHPLFRTDSPLPPPPTSPDTIVVASPWGGQVLHPQASQESFFANSSRNSPVLSRHASLSTLTALPKVMHGHTSSTSSNRPASAGHNGVHHGMQRIGSHGLLRNVKSSESIIMGDVREDAREYERESVGRIRANMPPAVLRGSGGRLSRKNSMN